MEITWSLSLRRWFYAPRRRSRHGIIGPVFFCLTAVLVGCGKGVFELIPATTGNVSIQGKVTGGNQPLSGAAVQVYAAGVTGDGSPSTPLLQKTAQTDQNGNFNLTGSFTCTEPTSQIYLIARGGSPVANSEYVNPAASLMAAVGTCGNLSASSNISINEVTTIGSIWPLAPFMESASELGSDDASASQFQSAVGEVNELVNIISGTAPGPSLPVDSVAPTAKLYTLADIVAGCINSRGGTAGDGSACGTLFQNATFGSNSPPTDTVAAALAIAQHPYQNVLTLFDLALPSSPFQPMLVSSPPDWTLVISTSTTTPPVTIPPVTTPPVTIPPVTTPPVTPSSVATPVMSLASGTYGSSQTLAMTDVTPSAAIFYTVDGSIPTPASVQYSGPVTIAASKTVKAVALANSVSSPIASVTLNIQPSVVITVSPTSVVLGPSETMTFSASVNGSTNSSVSWSVNPSVGIISKNGVYTAPSAVTESQTVTIIATSTANPSDATTATIQLLPTASTLREIGAMRGVLMGSAADGAESGGAGPIVDHPLYASTLGTQYSMLEPENAMKWQIIGAQQGTYDFVYGDALVSFAQAHGMKVRGHNLCWNQSNPAWLSTLSSTELSQTLHDYIFATMGHYKGQVFAWDVVNEAISNNATGVGTSLNDSVWYNQPGIGLSGTGYVEQAFRWARAADPTAKLFYNDHGTEITGKKSQALLNMLKDFISRGVPIDGVGLEMHVDTTTNYPATFPAALKAYTDLGLEVHITEMDVRLPVNAAGVASAADLKAQAATYSFIVNTCLQDSRCTAIQTWGFTDAWSWIPREYPGFGAALPSDKNYEPKPAFNSILSTLQTLTQ